MLKRGEMQSAFEAQFYCLYITCFAPQNAFRKTKANLSLLDQGMARSQDFSPKQPTLPNNFDGLIDANAIFKDQLWNRCGRL